MRDQGSAVITTLSTTQPHGTFTNALSPVQTSDYPLADCHPLDLLLHKSSEHSKAAAAPAIGPVVKKQSQLFFGAATPDAAPQNSGPGRDSSSSSSAGLAITNARQPAAAVQDPNTSR